jgi:hypothetical protein
MRDREPAAHRRMVVDLVPEVPPLRMSAELLVRQPDRPAHLLGERVDAEALRRCSVVRPPRVLLGEGAGLAGVSPPLADESRRRSLVSPGKDPHELGRLGEDPVGGQHEAREVLGTSGLGGGLALWYVFKNRLAVTASIVLLDPSGANSSGIKPAFGSGADCGTEGANLSSRPSRFNRASTRPACARSEGDHVGADPVDRCALLLGGVVLVGDATRAGALLGWIGRLTFVLLIWLIWPVSIGP